MDLCGGGYTFAGREAQKQQGFQELPASEGGAKIFLVMTDDFSRFRKTVLLKYKSQADQAIREWILELAAKGYKTETLRKDGGGEFGSKKLTDWLKERGIQEEDSAAYTPEQNGLAEKTVDLVCAKARSMLAAKDLRETLWAEAVVTATYLLNRSPTRVLPRGMTPYEAFYGEKPNIHHIRVFGCAAYARIHNANANGKLSPRSKKMRLVGYESTNIYRLWDSETRKITSTRDVVFDEGDLGREAESNRATAFPIDSDQSETENAPEDSSTAEESLTESEGGDLTAMAQRALEMLDIEAPEESHIAAAVVKDEKEPQRWPKSYQEARRSAKWSNWSKAMDAQIQALKANETWTLMDTESIPSEAKILSGKWVFTEKDQEDGTKIQKARWVVRGFEQSDDDINWEELKAATVKAQTTRILFALAAEQGWDVQQMDVVAAFLNGDIKEDIYVRQPSGYQEKGKVCKLQKALYGLRTSPAIWYGVQAGFLESIGYSQATHDAALFLRHSQNGTVYVSSHVDDFLITGSDSEGIQTLKSTLASRFEMKDLGSCRSYLGMEVQQNSDGIRLTQSKFITQLLLDTDMWDAKPKATPMEAGLEIEPAEHPVKIEEYRRIVGKILWLAIISRPDIAHDASQLATVAAKPSETAWQALKRVLRYLRGTITAGIWYRGKSTLTGYSDANWAEGATAKSTTGVIFMMNGGPIHWYSKKQPIVALSTCEAEYVAAAVATQDAAWLGPHVDEMTGRTGTAVPIRVDNQGAIALAKSNGWNRRTRHINARFQYVQKAVEVKAIAMSYIESKEQLADGLTKTLRPGPFGEWRARVMGSGLPE
jgi:Reverse transcriptase (RNA-dependent DNA polymerase)